MWSAIAFRIGASNSAAFRSSLSTARLAFLWSTLQRNGFTITTARSRTARTIGCSIPSRPTSSWISTRL